MSVSLSRWLAAAAAAVFAVPASAVIPYTPVPVEGPPVVGPGLIPADFVYGKEYSHDLDFSVVGPTSDPQQVIAWDGGGGTADGIDYSFTRPDWEVDQQVDAIANTRDALFDELRFDLAHLTYSHDDLIAAYGLGSGGPTLVTVPSGGPVFTPSGVIGGAGEVSTELAGAFAAPSTHTLWASQPEVNGMPLPIDVDGTELWGHEPREFIDPDLPVVGDADKYSLDVDFPSGVSVWNASDGSAYLDHPTVVAAVTSLLGPIPDGAFSLRDEQQGRNAINLDALMVSDIVGDPNVFDFDFDFDFVPTEPNGEPLVDQNGTPFEAVGPDGAERGDAVIFSIRQIVNPEDSDGYYATGSELFVIDGFGGFGFLEHGGHVWDHGYALSEMVYLGSEEGGQFDGYAVLDINAIEAIGEDQEKPCIPGDYNCDGKVDAADYTVWRDSEGATGFGLPADGNGDGTVDGADYDVWKVNFGAMAGMPATSVPEPTSVALAGLAAVAVVSTRQRVA